MCSFENKLKFLNEKPVRIVWEIRRVTVDTNLNVVTVSYCTYATRQSSNARHKVK